MSVHKSFKDMAQAMATPTVKPTQLACTVVVNDRAHKFGPATKTRQVTFEIALDMVEGWGHQLEDHIQAFFENDPYVLSARFED